MTRSKKKNVAIATLFILMALPLFPVTVQARDVRGTVVDGGNKPIPGASVIEKGTSHGTVTDVDGRFSIDAKNGTVLEIISLGFVSRTYTVGSENVIYIVLEEDSMLLDETVVVGYGTQVKASITGAVANVTNKDLITTKAISVANTVVGKLPGLRAVQRSGAPGEDMPEIDIRGFGSALIIVDGVERSFAKLDPNDVESISILKDASAAVYGSKGANGVILVTTKKGAEGRPVFEYNGWAGIQQMTRYPHSYSSYQYAFLSNEAANNIGLPDVYSPEQMERFINGDGEFYKSTDWLDAVTRKTAPVTAHNFSVKGGTKAINYFVSFGVQDQQSYFRSNDWYDRRYNVHANLSAELSPGLVFSVNTTGRLDSRNISGGTGVFYNIMTYKPFGSAWYYGEPTGPLRDTYYNYGRAVNDERVLESSFNIRWDVPWVEGLSAEIKASYDIYNYRNKNWSPKDPYRWEPVESGDVVRSAVGSTFGRLNDQMGTNTTKDIQANITYARKFGLHDIKAIALYHGTNSTYEWLSGYRQFALNLIPLMSYGDDENKTNGGSEGSSLMHAAVGRLNYAYADKYLAELVFRADASYLFAADKRWGFFPSASLGWRISEEDFIKDSVPWLSNLKLRASYGIVGDCSGFSAFQWMSGYIFPGGKFIFDEGKPTIGLYSSGLANEDLTWYKARTANIGLDAGFFGGKLYFEADVFHRYRSGLMSYRTATIPYEYGVSLPQENLNSDRTFGFEAVLGHSNTIGDLSYNLRANVSLTRTRNAFIERAMDPNRYENWRNNGTERYSGIGWGYRMIGQFQSFEEILSSPIQDGSGNKSLLPGDFKYEDINQDGIINGWDEVPISVGVTPFAYYALNAGLQWKGLDATIFLQGAGGHKLQLGMAFAQPFIDEGNCSGLTMWYDERSYRTEDGQWVIGKLPPVRKAGFTNNQVSNTYYTLDADYLRLKTLEMGYTLPARWTQSLNISRLRIYVNGNNLLTFTKGWMLNYIDPENSNPNAWYYPQAKTYNLGITLTF